MNSPETSPLDTEYSKLTVGLKPGFDYLSEMSQPPRVSALRGVLGATNQDGRTKLSWFMAHTPGHGQIIEHIEDTIHGSTGPEFQLNGQRFQTRAYYFDDQRDTKCRQRIAMDIGSKDTFADPSSTVRMLLAEVDSMGHDLLEKTEIYHDTAAPLGINLTIQLGPRAEFSRIENLLIRPLRHQAKA